MQRLGSMGYPDLAKWGFVIGALLFVVGAGGEVLAPVLIGPIPAWEQRLLFDLEAIGLLVGFFSPFIFGVMLPLIE